MRPSAIHSNITNSSVQSGSTCFPGIQIMCRSIQWSHTAHPRKAEFPNPTQPHTRLANLAAGLPHLRVHRFRRRNDTGVGYAGNQSSRLNHPVRKATVTTLSPLSLARTESNVAYTTLCPTESTHPRYQFLKLGLLLLLLLLLLVD